MTRASPSPVARAFNIATGVVTGVAATGAVAYSGVDVMVSAVMGVAGGVAAFSGAQRLSQYIVDRETGHAGRMSRIEKSPGL